MSKEEKLKKIEEAIDLSERLGNLLNSIPEDDDSMFLAVVSCLWTELMCISKRQDKVSDKKRTSIESIIDRIACGRVDNNKFPKGGEVITMKPIGDYIRKESTGKAD